MRLGVKAVEAIVSRRFVITAVEEGTSTNRSPTGATTSIDMKLAALYAARTTDSDAANLHPPTARW